jgi:glyoxylase-like metal-dependent hydrolase (beta-lactamase superfamily II)
MLDMKYTDRVDNVYLIDTKMFGFDQYNAAYIVKGKEIALIDTGLPNQIEAVRAGIRAHGFSPADISKIFITHEHGDHCGNVAPLLRENPKAKVYINPIGAEHLIDPSKANAKTRHLHSKEMLARFTDMEPVPPSRIEYLKDGDVFDLGGGEKLRIIFTPGHQPGGIVILEEKNKGLFINDLCGMYLTDADFSIIFTPPGSNVKQCMESLKKIKDIPVTRLFLGHFGISDKPREVIQRALDGMQRLLDIGANCVAEGKPEEIASRVAAIILPEVERVRAIRGEGLYEYFSREFVPHLARNFANYYLNLQ